MDPMEQELKDALRRQQAPDWFAQGVMAKVKAEQARKASHWSGWMRWATALAMLVVVMAGIRMEQVRRERIAGEHAKEQLILALQVTGSKLRQAQMRVQSVEERQ
jgi:hypothetical protein